MYTYTYFMYFCIVIFMYFYIKSSIGTQGEVG